MSQYFFLTSLLPPLPDTLGEKMPTTMAMIAGTIHRNVHSEHIELTRAHLHQIDSFNWEQMDQGRDLFLEGGILSRDELATNSELPGFIRTFREERERGIHRPCPYDRLWELYYETVWAAATRAECGFLTRYLSWEIGLRSALAHSRAREAGGNSDEHGILEPLAGGDFSNLISQLKSRKHPLDAERFLDAERLNQIHRREGIEPFSIDSVLAGFSRALIYARWERISADFDTENYLWRGGSN